MGRSSNKKLAIWYFMIIIFNWIHNQLNFIINTNYTLHLKLRLREQRKDDVMKIKDLGTESSSTGGKSTWSRPPVGRFKMNTDGVCPYPMIQADGVERGLAGYAGILRNDRGIWVRGFQGSFNGETKNIVTIELHGIHKGLKLLDKLKLKGSILESDNQAAVDWVNRQNNYRGNSPIINGCWDIIIESRQLKLKNDVAIVHIIGDNANQCADKLADIAAKKQGPYLEIRDLPPEISHLVVKDMKSLIKH